MSWWKKTEDSDKPVEPTKKETPPVVRERTAKQALCSALVFALLPFTGAFAEAWTYPAFERLLKDITPVINTLLGIFFVLSFHISYVCFWDYRTISQTGKPLLLTPELVAERQVGAARYLLRCVVIFLSISTLLIAALSFIKPLPLPVWGILTFANVNCFFGIWYFWRRLNAFDAKRLQAAAEKAKAAVAAENEMPTAPKHWWTANATRPKHWWTANATREENPQKVGRQQ